MESMLVDRFIPHQGRMKLVDTLIDFDAETKTGDVEVRLIAEAPYFVGSVFQGHWLIEIMAQAGAVVSQVLRTKDTGGEPSPGFLIAIRSFNRLDKRQLAPGDILRARAHFDVDMDLVGQCIGSIFSEDNTLIAQGEMTFLSSSAGDF